MDPSKTKVAASVTRQRRTLVLGAIVALLAASALVLPAVSLSFAEEGNVTVLAPGDIVRMAGTHVTCSVTRSGTPMLNCVRVGALPGTYGVRMSEKKVTVFRMRSATVGETVLTATHGERRFTTCRSGR